MKKYLDNLRQYQFLLSELDQKRNQAEIIVVPTLVFCGPC